jgi:hypothetical protein
VRIPVDRPIRGTWLYLGLTLASGLAAHLVFDAIDDGARAVVTHPIHPLYLLVVGAVFVLSWRELTQGDRANRRRRLAVARTAVRRSGLSPFVVACLLQAAAAGGTLMFEGAAIGGLRLAIAVVAAVLAMLIGALALRHIERRILRLVETVFISPQQQREVRRQCATDVFSCPVTNLCFFLVPNRPPPTFA